MRPSRSLIAYCWVLLLFLFAPILTLVVFSFDASGRGTLPLETLSFRWYREVISSSLIVDAFRNSAVVAIITAIFAVTLGTLCALGLFRRRIRWNTSVLVLVCLPIALPPLMLGIALLSLYKTMGVTLSLRTVIVAHILLTTPLVLATVLARLSNFDVQVEEAAKDLGATPLQTFWRVTFPIIRPSVIGATLLVLAVSLDEFIVTLFTIGPQRTVPVVIWGQMRRGVSPTVNAISALLLGITVIVVLVSRRLTGATLAGERSA